LRQTIFRALGAGVVIGLLGEISVNPFGTAFRFSLGPMGMAMLALFHWLPAWLAGAAAGLVVPLVHGVMAYISVPHIAEAGLLNAVNNYVPETLAYTVLGMALSLFQLHNRSHRPFQSAVLLALADFTCNMAEMTLRPDPYTLHSISTMALVAVGRSAVSLGAFYILQEGVRQRAWEAERRSYMEKLLFVANLQTEAFFLKKSAGEIEQIMAKAHRLYRDLSGHPYHQPLALDIAKDIHEVKKDYQRTLGALHRLVEIPSLRPEMDFVEVVALVMEVNHTYAATLGKDITFVTDLDIDFRTPRFGRWVSILNNLVSNGVEACGAQGKLTVSAARVRETFVLQVTDTGSGIPPEDWELIFSPGFSTKLNPVTGAFSSGIGLTHVAGLVRSMAGTIRVAHSDKAGTTFRLEVPWESLEHAVPKE
jgi:two-component system sensor histidine kinase YcbA